VGLGLFYTMLSLAILASTASPAARPIERSQALVGRYALAQVIVIRR
jgi:hypothetical protein